MRIRFEMFALLKLTWFWKIHFKNYKKLQEQKQRQRVSEGWKRDRRSRAQTQWWTDVMCPPSLSLFFVESNEQTLRRAQTQWWTDVMCPPSWFVRPQNQQTTREAGSNAVMNGRHVPSCSRAYWFWSHPFSFVVWFLSSGVKRYLVPVYGEKKAALFRVGEQFLSVCKLDRLNCVFPTRDYVFRDSPLFTLLFCFKAFLGALFEWAPADKSKRHCFFMNADLNLPFMQDTTVVFHFSDIYAMLDLGNGTKIFF